jgi:hypothetical protein
MVFPESGQDPGHRLSANWQPLSGLQRPHRVYCEFPWVCIFILKTSLPFVDGDFYRGGIVSVAHVLLSILSVRSAGSRGSPVTPWLWAIPGIRMDNKIITHRQIDSS